jgi:S-adenosylmethionine:tRNA ribosyltransferase-isomerase
MNNTRVLPARLIGKKETGGKFEALLIPPTNGLNGEYEVLIKGSGKVKQRIRVQFDQDLYGEVTEVKDGKGKIRFSYQMEIMDLLQKIGHIPLPPYIKRGDEPLDKIRYQTVIAERKGSIAAPTAALHFTQPLLQSIKNGGVNIVTITLHIGIGTFTPVKSEEVEDHRM